MTEPLEKAAGYAEKVASLRDVYVKIHLDHLIQWMRWGDYTLEQRAKALEKEAKDFEEFVRDHRSQDPVQLEVVREYTDVCSKCDNPWEVDDSEEPWICAHCGNEVSL